MNYDELLNVVRSETLPSFFRNNDGSFDMSSLDYAPDSRIMTEGAIRFMDILNQMIIKTNQYDIKYKYKEGDLDTIPITRDSILRSLLYAMGGGSLRDISTLEIDGNLEIVVGFATLAESILDNFNFENTFEHVSDSKYRDAATEYLKVSRRTRRETYLRVRSTNLKNRIQENFKLLIEREAVSRGI